MQASSEHVVAVASADPVSPKLFLATGVSEAACKARFVLPVSFAPFAAETVSQALEAGQTVVVVYLRAAPFLQRAIEAGQTPGAALAAWVAQAQELLATQRQARRRVLLLEEALLVHGAAPELARLVERFAEAGSGSAVLTDTPVAVPAVTGLAAVLGAQALASSQAARALSGELEVGSLAFPAQLAGVEAIDALLAETLSQQAALVAAQERAQRLVEVEDAAQKAAEDAAGEKARLLAEVAELTGKLAAAEEGGAQAEALCQEREAEAHAAKAECQLLLGHIGELNAESLSRAAETEALKAQSLAAEKLAAERAQALVTLEQGAARERVTSAAKAAEIEAERKALAAERTTLLDRVKQLEAEQRAAGEKLAQAQARDTALEAERVLLLQHLEELRAESGQMNGRSQAQQERLNALEAELALTLAARDQAQGDLAQKQQELGLTQQARDEGMLRATALGDELEAAKKHWDEILTQAQTRELTLSAQLAALQAEFEKLVASRSWKVTQPLRSVNSLLGGTKSKDE